MVSVIKKTEVVALIGILAFLLVHGCANQLPPGGGPTDTIPPEIIDYYPQNGTINFDGDYFELTFSEYVDKRSLKDAIFISPAIGGIPEIDWSGKTARIYFPEKLLDSITYTISIGTDVIDYNNRNRMAESFVFAFSTGDKIDNFTISGKVYEERPSGTLIFAFRNPADTLDPSKTRPDYISQAGEKGDFRFTGLAGGTYRLFAIKEEIKDQIYDKEKDKIGVPPIQPVLSDKDTGYTKLNMIMFTEDNTPPRILSANMLDRYHVLTVFSEELNAPELTLRKFEIIDSITGTRTFPEYIYKGRGKSTEYFLGIKDSLYPESNSYLIVTDFSDIAGNSTKYDAVKLNISGKPDTLLASLIRTEPAYNTKTVDHLNCSFTFTFDDGFPVNELNGLIYFKDSSNRAVAYDFIKNDDASFTLKPTAGMRPGTDYYIAFNLLNVVDLAGNAIDSNYVYKFKTLSELDYTGLSGELSGVRMNKNPVLILESTERTGNSFSTVPGAKGSFEFKRVLPGKYNLYILYDLDGNGKISRGEVTPYKPAEEFYYYGEVISLLPRWAVTDLLFDLQTP